MNTLDRYILLEHVKPFSFFVLVFTGILWLIQCLPLLDDVISNGQSSKVFIDLAMLLVPQVIFVVSPMAAFGATLYTINRLLTESELIVIMSAGISNFKLARTILFFGLIVSFFMFFLSLYLVPVSQNKLRNMMFEIRQEFSNRLIKGQEFFHPIPNVTIYRREASRLGEMKGVFLTDARKENNILTYSAKEAVIKKNQDNLILVMKDGILQISDLYGESLTTLKFSRLGFDINEFLPSNFRKDLSPLEVSPLKVLKNPQDYSEGNHYKSNDFIGEAHLKLATPIAPIALTVMALSAFLVTGFNRKGYSKSIVIVIFVGIVVQAFTASLRTTIVRDPSLSVLIYLPSIVCFLLSIIIIVLSQNPIQMRQKIKPNNLKL